MLVWTMYHSIGPRCVWRRNGCRFHWGLCQVHIIPRNKQVQWIWPSILCQCACSACSYNSFVGILLFWHACAHSWLYLCRHKCWGTWVVIDWADHIVRRSAERMLLCLVWVPFGPCLVPMGSQRILGSPQFVFVTRSSSQKVSFLISCIESWRAWVQRFPRRRLKPWWQWLQIGGIM